MPSNNRFWIFPNNHAVSVIYSSGSTYDHMSHVNNIYGLFTTQIASVGPGAATAAATHAPNYYSDNHQHALLSVVLGQAESNMDTILRNHSHAPLQGRGTSIIINGVRVYHETRTRNDDKCTIFYTFDHNNRNMTVHAVGAHMQNGYFLDCASQAFDQAVGGLGGNQWGYVSRGIVRL